MISTKEILSKFKNVALVGASGDLTKTSSIVMKYLQNSGFKVYPVNPNMKGQKILGEIVFGKISEIKSPVEIIDVFRPSNEAIDGSFSHLLFTQRPCHFQTLVDGHQFTHKCEEHVLVHFHNVFPCDEHSGPQLTCHRNYILGIVHQILFRFNAAHDFPIDNARLRVFENSN